jgi:hypothetical protein
MVNRNNAAKEEVQIIGRPRIAMNKDDMDPSFVYADAGPALL